MRKMAWMALVGLASLVMAITPAFASHGGSHGAGRGQFHHGHTGAFFSFHFFGPLYPPWYAVPYPYYPYYYYPYYYPAPPADYSYPAPPQAPREIGYLQLDVFPTEAHIYMDGRYVGPVQQFPGGSVPVSPGTHQVAVVAWGHRPFQREVQITTGESSTLSVVLERDPTAPMGPPQGPSGGQGQEPR